MKRIIILAAYLACFTFAGAVYAQAAGEGEKPVEGEKPAPKEEKKPEGEKRPERTGGGAREIARIMRERDKDADKKLSKEEFGGDKVFDELDADKDGFLSVQELTAGSAKVNEEMKRQARVIAEEEFSALDRDSDKKLTAEELGDSRKSYLENGDKNKDASLDVDEYVEAKAKAGAEAAAKAGEEERKKAFEDAWKGLDKDGDGKLTGDEIPERMKKNLEKIDTDADGSISKEEMEAARKVMGRRGGEGGKRPEKPKSEGETPKKDETKEEGF